MTKGSLILIDYENLYNSGATNHQLKMTEKGFDKLVSHFVKEYNSVEDLVFVACHFGDYEGLLSLVEELSYKPITSIEKGDNMADGYLIAHGMKEILKYQETIDKVILIAGDGIYTGLVRLASAIVDEIHVIFWEKSFSENLKKVNRKKVKVDFIENVFNLEEKKADGWFEDYGLTDVDKEIIKFLDKAEKDDGFQLVALANIMKNWRNPAVKEKFGGDFDAISGYLHDCTSKNGYLNKKRAPQEKGGRDVWWIKMDRTHLKVKDALGQK